MTVEDYLDAFRYLEIQRVQAYEVRRTTALLSELSKRAQHVEFPVPIRYVADIEKVSQGRGGFSAHAGSYTFIATIPIDYAAAKRRGGQ